MRTRFLIALAALAFCYSAAPGHAARTASPAPAAPSLDQGVAFPGGVIASPGRVYAKIEGFRPLTLDLYQIPPKPKETARPAILFVHGGLWLSGDARSAPGFDDFPATLAALSAKGYVVASVNYRLADEAHFPAAVQDVKSALRWLRTHATDYDIDTTRVMVWGTEAGGQIAALVGTSCGVNVLEPAADAKSKAPMASDCVEGVIDWSGPVDLVGWDPDAGRTAAAGTATPLGSYLGCEPADCAAGVVRAASPLSYLETMTPPFLIQQGAADTRVPPDQSRKLYDALQNLHVPSTLVVYPDIGENFSRNGAPDPAVNAKAVADMEDFIAKTFPAAPAPAKEEPRKSAAKKTRK
ncbi:MAG TPA: alpha/beta hydrolase [Rhizomicrobium sp.]|nr:alpha/beta hydrolase [Rhizomicrobium sp.]